MNQHELKEYITDSKGELDADALSDLLADMTEDIAQMKRKLEQILQ